MKKITQIQISNYRAFYNENSDNYTITLPKGENLLVYGENGSGKSSFFHALQDFFLSAKSAKETEKNKENNSLSIREKQNIFSQQLPHLPEPKVSVFFSTKATNGDKKWEQDSVPFIFADTSTTTGDMLKNASQAFLSYRDMLKTYFLDNEKKESPNLFELLIENLLGKIELDTTEQQEVAEEFLKTIKQIQTLEQAYKEALNSKIQEGEIPSKDDKEEIWETLLEGIAEKIEIFNQNIHNFLNEVLQEINDFLRAKKYFNANIELKLTDNSSFLSIENGELKKQLRFEIEYFGEKIANTAYHHFLNEARLSALAICIYLVAIKKDKPTEGNYKILFLDDIFIGLDMSNRLPLLEILKTEFPDYQIFMTTYDRAWFEVAKDNLDSNWKAIEMYVGEKDGFDVPVIIDENLELFEKAEMYFKAHDYFAAGNYLRRTIEKLLADLIPITYRLEAKDLQGMIDKLSQYYDDCSCADLLPEPTRQSIKQYKDIVFNPASHYDLRSPLYKAEIQKAIDLVKLLQSLPKIERKLLVGMKSNLYYENSEKQYKATFITSENIYGIFVENQEPRITDSKHKLIDYTYPNDTNKTINSTEFKLSERIARIKHKLQLEDLPNWKEVFYNSEGKTLQQFIENL